MLTISLVVLSTCAQADESATLVKVSLASHQSYRASISQGRIQYTFRTGFGRFDEAKGTVDWVESANGWPGLNVGNGIFVFRDRNAIWRKQFDNDTKDKCTKLLPGGRISTFEAIDQEFLTDGLNTITRAHMFDKLKRTTSVNPQFVLSKGQKNFTSIARFPTILGHQIPWFRHL